MIYLFIDFIVFFCVIVVFKLIVSICLNMKKNLKNKTRIKIRLIS